MLVWALLSEFAAVGVFGMRLGDVGAGDDAADAGDGADSIKLFLNNKVCEICVSRIYFEIYKK